MAAQQPAGTQLSPENKKSSFIGQKPESGGFILSDISDLVLLTIAT